MSVLRAFSLCASLLIPCAAATFGTVVPHASALADLVLDEARNRLYLVNTLANTVEVYNTKTSPPSLVTSIATGATPLAAAISRAGNSLYVACYGASALDIIDLTSSAFSSRSVALSASPEAVAVGANEKVLISTIGTGTGQDVLVTYDPSAAASSALQSIAVAPTAPAAPTLSPSNMAEAAHARLAASADGSVIVGAHELANNTRTVFAFNVASSTVLGSRNVGVVSPVLAVSANGSAFLSGPMLFDTASLYILAQQNATNSPFVFPATANFNTQASQGGAVFAQTALGAALITAYNIVPTLSPAAASNTSELLINSPDSLLIKLGIMLPENLSGKMVATSNSSTLYAISQSGFMVLPIGTLLQQPIALPDSNVALLVYDQCGANAAQNSAVIPVRNIGGGRITVTAQVLASSTTSATVRAAAQPYGANVTVSFSSAATRTIGTAAPDQLLIQSAEAVNIIPNVRVFQNNRNPESRGAIFPVDIGATNTGLTDIVQDKARQRLYLANPAQNRIEIFDMAQQQFLTPITVGQLPRSMAMGGDGNTLYVANSGGESISIVDLTQGAVTGRVNFPPIPFNATFALITPEIVANTQRAPIVVMSDGSLWKIVSGSVAPVTLNSTIFGTTRTLAAPQTMASSADGAYLLVLGGGGAAYLYQSSVDDFVSARPVVTAPITGYFGPIAAGPGGQYYVIDNQLLNAALTTVTPGGAASARPVAAVTAVGAQNFARFSTPARASAGTAPADAGLLEVVDATTQRTTASANSLEAPLTQAIGATRTNVNGRTMAVDAAGVNAYVLTASGLTVIPLAAASPAAPAVSRGGVVNTANYTSGVAPGGLISIFGQNLAAGATAAVPLPQVLGGVCVTLNNTALPLLATSAGQINAQIRPNLAAGTYPLVIHSISGQTVSASVNVMVSKYAPAIFLDTTGAYIYHQNGTRVDRNHPATRDEPLVIYATGLGATTSGTVTAGVPAPSSPLAVTAPVQLFFGDPTISDSGVIVDWSGLLPGYIGVYQINARIPGTHLDGNGLAVDLRIGGADSATTGPGAALVYVD